MNVLEVDFEKKLKNFPLHIQFQAEGGCIGMTLEMAEKIASMPIIP